VREVKEVAEDYAFRSASPSGYEAIRWMISSADSKTTS
jgi:hypothetical protein